MPSEPLRRCLRLLECYERRETPPWRPRQPHGPPPAPLTLGELHRLWRALLAEGPAVAAPGLAEIVADPARPTLSYLPRLTEADVLSILRGEA